MEIKAQLRSHSEKILNNWIAGVSNYASAENGSASQFENPFLFAMTNEFRSALEWLFADDPDLKQPDFFTVIKMKAVSGQPVSESLDFLVVLKTVLLPIIKSENLWDKNQDQVSELFAKIDHLLLETFQQYTQNRETVHELKLKEIQSGVFINEAPGASCPSAMITPEPINSEVR